MATPAGTGPIAQDVAPKGGFPAVSIGLGNRNNVLFGLCVHAIS